MQAQPATNGKVIIETTTGEVEVELWGKEAPQAVRNFLALSMEGYYDGVIFHRIVPGFIVQTGDPTGTGTGGESFYGEPFQDEVHGRLRFNKRGLVGMANRGKRHTNTSQFFITLDKADELTNKHTLFGRVVGNTYYNVLTIGNMDIDAEERPLHPPKIRAIRIVENPFDDIIPRITASERRAQHQARLDAKQETEQRDKRAKAKKNTGLLSFGEAEEVPAEAVKLRTKGMGRQDLVEEAPPPTAVQSYVNLPPSLQGLATGPKGDKRKTVDFKDIRAQHERGKQEETSARQVEIKRMQDNLRELKKRSGDSSDSGSDSSGARRKKRRAGASYLEEELAGYSTGRGRAAMRTANKRGRRDEEEDLLLEMGKFSKRVALAEDREGSADEKAAEEDAVNEDGLEVDDDVGWMRHRLKFVVDEKELTRRAEDEYAVIDPRAKARQLVDEQKREKDIQRRGKRPSADVGRNQRR